MHGVRWLLSLDECTEGQRGPTATSQPTRDRGDCPPGSITNKEDNPMQWSHRRGARSRWLELASVSGIVVLVISIALLTDDAPQSSRGSAVLSQMTPGSSPTAITEATPYPTFGTTPSSEYAEYPPEKATAMAQEDQAAATARASGPSKETLLLTATAGVPTPALEPTLQAGIVTGIRQGPFSPTEFSIVNFWQGPVGSSTHWLLVFAGVAKNPADGTTGPGALRIYDVTTTPTGILVNYSFAGVFSPTNDVEALEITAVSESQMQLRTAGGEAFSFDLQTYQFR